MHYVHADTVGWRVNPWLVRSRSNLEGHCDQTCIVCDVVSYMKLLVFRQVRDRLGRPNRSVYFAHRVGWNGLITVYRVREDKHMSARVALIVHFARR